MPYTIKHITRNKESGWAVLDEKGRISNDWIFPKKEDAERKLELSEDYFNAAKERFDNETRQVAMF